MDLSFALTVKFQALSPKRALLLLIKIESKMMLIKALDDGFEKDDNDIVFVSFFVSFIVVAIGDDKALL